MINGARPSFVLCLYFVAIPTFIHFRLSSNFIPDQSVHLSFVLARVDIAGTWSDTPPICYEHGGSVITAGVKIDSKVCKHILGKLYINITVNAFRM